MESGDYDTYLRSAAFAYLDQLRTAGADTVRFDDVAAFVFDGQRVALMDRQRGIRKPRQLDAALSFRTVHPKRPDVRPYEDGVGLDGYQRYKWRGLDPYHPENMAMRRAAERGLPLIWFHGFAQGAYLPLYPVWLVGEEPASHQFVVAVDAETKDEWAPGGMLESVSHRRYAERTVDDVATMSDLPGDVELVTAGFPCTDLSQAGRTAGIRGEQSGLVSHVFDMLGPRQATGRPVTWLVIENVQNLLALDRGEGMRYLVDQMERLGYRWAYRLVDSRFTGVPQRRRRVLVVASPIEDPRAVLFADDAGPPDDRRYRDDAFGFYWTEGLGGLGWAHDAVPTLKGGSTVGIPSPPAIWVPDAGVGRQLVVPTIKDAEALQGFPRGWTDGADLGRRNGPRWKLVGNAVTVGVATWLGDRLADPGDAGGLDESVWTASGSWPSAAWGENGKVFAVRASEYPRMARYRHLRSVVDIEEAPALSARGTRGFRSRLERSNLGRHPGFRDAVWDHAEWASARERSIGL